MRLVKAVWIRSEPGCGGSQCRSDLGRWKQSAAGGVQNGSYDIALYLMDHGANPNLANEKGWTPLQSGGEES